MKLLVLATLIICLYTTGCEQPFETIAPAGPGPPSFTSGGDILDLETELPLGRYVDIWGGGQWFLPATALTLWWYGNPESEFRSPEIDLPVGEWDIEIEIHGGLIGTWTYLHRNQLPELDGRFIGPGGYRLTEPHLGPDRRLFQTSVEFVDPSGHRRPIWLAPANDEYSAAGMVKVRGPGKVRFTRAWGGDHPPPGIVDLWGNAAPAFNWTTDQRGRLVARRVQEAEVALICSPARITRGDPVTCTASSPESGWEVTGWKFVSSDGQEEVEPLDPAQESSPRWYGPMVRSGTVYVTATVGGHPKTASAGVVVDDRNWAGRAPTYTFTRIENGEDSRLVLEDVVRWSHDLGAANWFQAEKPGSTVPDFTTEVPSGPNGGLDYFSEETTLRVFGYYVLNQAAMSRGSRFYAAQQRGGGSGGTQIGGVNWCPASVVTGSLPALVEAHEKLHGSVYERAFVREAGAALTRLERTTASNVGVLYDEYDLVWEQVDRIARAESEAIHGQPDGSVSPTSGGRPCALRSEFGSILQREP